MAIVQQRPRARRSTPEEAISFFGHLLDAAIKLGGDDVVPAAWPIDVLAIAAEGVSEGRARACGSCGPLFSGPADR
jgi:hypothetical protein